MYPELQKGLQAHTANIPSKYLYNKLGSKLFEVICIMPEYYLTRIEAAIFNKYINDIKETIGTGMTLIDLGAGNCSKAARLMSLLKPKQYVPIDISSEFLENAVYQLQTIFPKIPMYPITTDFAFTLKLPSFVNQNKRLFFYPGSSFGNFSPKDALQFLCCLRSHCLELQDGSGILFGIDLVKKKDVIDAAYNDVLGITASFNSNILLHVNQLLDTNFDVFHWKYKGCFNEITQCVEMYLEAKCEVVIKRHQKEIRYFRKGECIYTENSYKFTPENIKSLLNTAGFTLCNAWFDPAEWFMLFYAKPNKSIKLLI